MWREIFANFIESGKMRMGISSLSKLTGVSTRQLRYWEEKGYIQSMLYEKNMTRHYDFNTVIKVQVIHYYLEEGYTLCSAVEHAERDREDMRMAKSFIGPMMNEIISNKDQDYLFELSPIDDPDGEPIVAIFDPETKKFTYCSKSSIDSTN